MSTTVFEFLTRFDEMTTTDQHEATIAILQRAGMAGSGLLSDEMLTELADQAFLALDREESGVAKSPAT